MSIGSLALRKLYKMAHHCHYFFLHAQRLSPTLCVAKLGGVFVNIWVCSYS